MTNLVSAAQFKAITPVSLSVSDLNGVIARVEAEITSAIGAPYAATLDLTETLSGGVADLYLIRPVSEIGSVTEYDSWITADANSESLTEGAGFVLWADRGQLTRINDRATWDVKTVIVYTPRDDLKLRRQVIIDLVRVDLARTAYRSESVGGAYSYNAPPDWEATRRQIMRRLQYTMI